MQQLIPGLFQFLRLHAQLDSIGVDILIVGAGIRIREIFHHGLLEIRLGFAVVIFYVAERFHI
jgi:hypothetical protein